MKEIHLTKKDFRVDWFSGTGGGGQYRNKHQNCCRITHIATGLTATGQSYRERPANQKEAFNKLANLIISYYNTEENLRRVDAQKIRTYHAGRNEVLDHASGFTETYDRVVIKGEIGSMVIARKEAIMDEMIS